MMMMESGGAAVDDEGEWALGGLQEAALLVSDIEAKPPACHYEPPPVEILVHVLFDFLRHLLFVGPAFEGVVDDPLGLVLHLRLHLRKQRLHSPLLRPLQHTIKLPH